MLTQSSLSNYQASGFNPFGSSSNLSDRQKDQKKQITLELNSEYEQFASDQQRKLINSDSESNKLKRELNRLTSTNYEKKILLERVKFDFKFYETTSTQLTKIDLNYTSESSLGSIRP